MLPEELPVVLTVFTAMGAWRISKAKVLTRRMAAIETLGLATVLCTDKTGTLTEYKMRVTEVRLATGQRLQASDFANADPAGQALLRTAILASASSPVDPMELAFQDAGQGVGHMPTGGPAHAFGLRPDLLAVTHLWRRSDHPSLLAAAKGAPEAISELCALPEAARAALMGTVNDMAGQGLRVIGIARGVWDDAALPASPRAISFEGS